MFLCQSKSETDLELSLLYMGHDKTLGQIYWPWLVSPSRTALITAILKLEYYHTIFHMWDAVT